MDEDKRLAADTEAKAPKIKQHRAGAGKTVTICLIIAAFALGVLTNAALGSRQASSGSQFSIFESVYELMRDKWYFGKDDANLSDDLLQAAIKGMVNAQGDIHTEYMTADEMESFSSSLDNRMVGIGIQYAMLGGKALVREVLADSPAEKAGLATGDCLTAIDGKTTQDMDTAALKAAVSGQAGTEVTVTVERGSDTFNLTLTRANILTSVTSAVKDGNIGYLTINSFSSGTAEELKGHLDDLQDRGITKLVIDLRGNGGGYLDTLVKIASFFMDKDATVLIQEFRDGSRETEKTTGGRYTSFQKIILLVDGNSASCTEVFAAAMRENNGTALVGTTTYGKGTVQVAAAFSDGSALKYTDAQWLTPGGESINGTGVQPDYEVELDPALSQALLTLEDKESYAYDSVSDKTASAQLILKFLGYGIDRTDGYFDKPTQTALAQFQEDSGLAASGSLDQASALELDSRMLREWDAHPEKYDTQLNKALELINE